MYSTSSYKHDLRVAAKPMGKSFTRFWKVFLSSKLDPFQSFGPCVALVAWTFAFLFAAAHFTLRRIFNA